MVGETIARYINENFPENSLIALNTAGSTPYYAFDYRYIDMLGLNDTIISHRKITSKPKTHCQELQGLSKGNGKNVLSRKPDYIFLVPAQGNNKNAPWFLSDFEIVTDSSFYNNYEEVIVDFDSK